jgi:hypothetical protein
MASVQIKKQSRAGLFLWDVTIYPPELFNGENPRHLWITTRRDDIAAAVARARDFVGAHPKEYKGWTVQEVKEQGTIDT